MKLEDFRKDYYGFSTKASELSRQLSFAGGLSEFLCARPRRLVHGGGRRLRRTTDAVGKSVVPCYATVLMKRSP